MTPLQDFFVGLVAIIFGCLLTLGAIFNSAPLMLLAKPRLLADAVGKTTARWIVGAIGVAVVTLGILIASGWRMRW
jgi:hypothetical protein